MPVLRLPLVAQGPAVLHPAVSAMCWAAGRTHEQHAAAAGGGPTMEENTAARPCWAASCSRAGRSVLQCVLFPTGAAGGVEHRVHAHHAVVAGRLLRRIPVTMLLVAALCFGQRIVRHHPCARQRWPSPKAHRGRAVRHDLRLFRAAPPQTAASNASARPRFFELLPASLASAYQHRKASLHQPGRRGQDLSCLFQCRPITRARMCY